MRKWSIYCNNNNIVLLLTALEGRIEEEGLVLRES
jgi:hypothetical protein